MSFYVYLRSWRGVGVERTVADREEPSHSVEPSFPSLSISYCTLNRVAMLGTSLSLFFAK